MAEFIARNGLIAQNNSQITGSLTVTQGITGSLFGTATTASYYAEKDPVFTAKSGSLATTGSNTFIGNQTITGSLLVSGSTTLSGSLFVNTVVSSSIQPANNPSASLMVIGGTTIQSASILNSSAVLINPIMSASANSQTLVGLDISPTFVNNGFTGITNYGTRLNSNIRIVDALAASGSANAGSLLDLQQTWNTTGTPTAIKLNVTDTNSNASSLLMDLQVASSSVFRITKSGGFFTIGNINAQRYTLTNGFSAFLADFDGGINVLANTTGNIYSFAATRPISPTTGTGVFNGFSFLSTINQTGGASGITRGLYINPTLTSAADFRAIETSNGKVIHIDTVVASGSANAGSLLDLQQTWNTTGTPTAIKLNVTDTASNAVSKLLDIQKNASSLVSVYKTISRFNVPIYVGGTATTDTATALFVTQGGFGASGGGTIRDFYSGRGLITTGTATIGINFFEVGGAVTQSSGSTGISRGLYINPTLTGAYDFRAIEVTAGKLVFSATNTAAGTTGAQTINKISGKVNAAAGTTSLVVTNSLVTAASIVMCQLGTNDVSCVIRSVVEAAGSFTINYAAPTAETVIKFTVIN